MTQYFINLPTEDLERSKSFYTALGATIDPSFTDGNAACIVWDEHVRFMVLRRDFFGTFTDKPIADPRVTAQVFVALSRDSRDEVDVAVANGVAAGGNEPRPPQDYGFMYSRDLQDPDGNELGFLYMDPDAAANTAAPETAEQPA